jgi:hypothetical protein
MDFTWNSIFCVFQSYCIIYDRQNHLCCNKFYLFTYRAYVVILIFLGFLPITITVIFAAMAYHNARQLVYYTVTLVRRGLDKQLTAMVLVQVLVDFFLLSPNSIVNAVALNANRIGDPIVQAQIQLCSNL